jgi:undecaprenyl diphosphate synthase
VLVPRHVAIIMDGNGRWAAERSLPRVAGHRAGLKPVRMVIAECSQRGVEVLTLFAFSTENWRRPAQEVGLLMKLFLEVLDREVDELAAKDISVRFIGEREALAPELRARIQAVESRTGSNRGLKLVIAVGYGGRWDIVQAARTLALRCERGELKADDIDEQMVAGTLSLAGLPDPDLFIRTGGEHRISNFLLWNLAYCELWFSDVYWPEFDLAALEQALAAFGARERRFGTTSQQVAEKAC